MWIAALQEADEEGQGAVIHLLGPVFTSAMTEQYIRRHMQGMALSLEIQNRLWAFLKDVPAISMDLASCYASMLHFTVAREAFPPEAVEVWSEAVPSEDNAEWGSTDWHGDWTAEKQFFDSISEGRFVDLNRITTGKIGNIGGGDPLRQAKNQVIVLAVLCSRAAIMGGVSVEGSLGLCDFFITSAEAEDTVPGVNAIGLEMYRTYIQRVQKVKADAGYSPLIRSCCEYIETHIFEKIRLGELASHAGYTETYVRRKFKSEVGEGISDYVNRRKVEMAKRLLRESPVSVAELSDRLAFSSPSYFSSVFKKHTNMCPVEYQNAPEAELEPADQPKEPEGKQEPEKEKGPENT